MIILSKYICKIATVDEVSKKFDYEISVSDDKDNWICWKKEAVARTKKGLTITYMGLLDNEIICECTAALDPKTAKKVLDITEKIVSKDKLTTFMVTHNMKDAINYGDRLLMLNEGKIILDIKGEEKKKLTVEKLLKQFEKASGEQFTNDAAILN